MERDYSFWEWLASVVAMFSMWVVCGIAGYGLYEDSQSAERKPLTDTQRIDRLEQACFGRVMDTATDEEVQKVVQEIDDQVADEQSRLRKVEKHVDQNSERLLKLEARKK